MLEQSTSHILRKNRETEPTHHSLKIWHEYFKQVVLGNKTAELRKCDRPFKVGDTIDLREWDTETHSYTGMGVRVRITYIIFGGAFGLAPGYAILCFKKETPVS